MPNPVWPVTLPGKQFVGLTEKRGNAKVRSEMDAGTVKTRRRFTAVPRSASVPIILTNAQRQDFDTFWTDVLFEGSVPFDWEDPVTDATVTIELVEYPDWTLSTGSAGRIWSGNLSLLIQP